MGILVSRAMVSLALFALASGVDGQTVTDCKETRSTRVEAREFVPERLSYQDIRTRTLNGALVDAVKQTLGTRVAQIFTTQTSTSNNNVDEQSRDLSSEKARGYVKSYKVVSERIEGQGNAKTMIIIVDAEVCVPSAQRDKDVVAIGDFILSNGRKWDQARSIIAGKASQAKNLVVGSGMPNSIPHDIEVKGRLISFETADIVDKDSQGMSIFGALLGTIGAATARDKDAPNLQGLADKLGAASKKKRVTVVVAIEAVKRTDNELVSETSEASVEIPGDQNPQSVAENLIRNAVAVAATNLFAKLEGGGGSGFDLTPTQRPVIQSK